jgi:hypothetical protein
MSPSVEALVKMATGCERVVGHSLYSWCRPVACHRERNKSDRKQLDSVHPVPIYQHVPDRLARGGTCGDVICVSCGRVRPWEQVVFDHTVRESGSTAGLNAVDGAGQAVAPVLRAHCDYTEMSGPKRVAAVLAEDAARRRAAGAGAGAVLGAGLEVNTETTAGEVLADRLEPGVRHYAPLETGEGLEKSDDDHSDEPAAGWQSVVPGPAGGGDEEPRYAIVNVWRGVPGEAPVSSYATSSV